MGHNVSEASNPHDAPHRAEVIQAIAVWDTCEGHINTPDEAAAAAEAHEDAIKDHLERHELSQAIEHMIDLSMLIGSAHRLVYEQPEWMGDGVNHQFDQVASAWSRSHSMLIEWVC